MSGRPSQDKSRQGLAVVAPTTDQPILIRRLTLSPKIPASRVVLDNETADQCEHWTKDYNNLLRPDAPARSLLGLPEGGGYRLVVSSDIDHGKSWILPVMAAHAAQAAEIAVVDQMAGARALLWTTGALNLAYAETLAAAGVVDDDYHLKTKIDRSRALFADAAHAGTPIICLLPKSQGDQEAATWLAAILKNQPHHIRIIESLSDVVNVIAAFAVNGRIADLSKPLPGQSRDLVTISSTVDATGDAPEPQGNPFGSDGVSEQNTPVPRAASAVSSAAQAAVGDAVRAHAADIKAADAKAATAPAAARNARPGRPTAVIAGLAAGVLVAAGVGAYVLTDGTLLAGRQGQAGATGSSASTPATTGPVQVATPVVGAASTRPAVPDPVTGPAQAVVRLVMLRAVAGRSCQATIMDMQPRFEEIEQMLNTGQTPVDIDRQSVCGVSVSGLNQVSAAFVSTPRELTVPSLSAGSRLILNPIATGQSQQLTIQLSGAQTGQITLNLR
jgi:hypothetical protein